MLLVTILVLAGCGNGSKPVQTTQYTPIITTIPTQTQTPTTEPSSPNSNAISLIEVILENIYNQVNPSVVNISVTLFGGEGLASGFVWDTGGNIVTNNHVVDGARDILVTFSDGTIAPA